MSDPDSHPMPGAAAGREESIMRLVAVREHTLLALSELSQELSVSLDIFSLTDTILLNLMGQLGASKAGLWLKPEMADAVPILVRSHGLSRQALQAISSACAPALLRRFETDASPLRVDETEGFMGQQATRLMEDSGIHLIAPLRSRDETVGLVGIGPRISGSYGPIEVATLQAALVMVGVTIQNMKLYNEMLEKNRELQVVNENLSELDRLKSQFIQNVNHELRTPLTVILGYVALLLDLDPATSRGKDFVDVIYQEALKLQRLIENLLTFSAASNNQLQVQLAPGSVAEVVERLHAERQPGITMGLREFTYSVEPDLPEAHFEERRVREILNSLLDNAVKFTPVGARIHLSASRMEDAGCSWVRVDVEDNGPGIPGEATAGMFEAFRQGDGSSTRAVGGLGIGLTVARQIARSMGGDLRVASAVGQGSAFSLLLPTADETTEQTPQAA